MKSPSTKFPPSADTLESRLRNSAPTAQLPAGLHDSIMRDVQTTARRTSTSPSGFGLLWRLAQIRWLAGTGFAALVVFGIWLAFQNHTQSSPSDQALPEISAAFSAGQDAVEALPSVTVGPLSDELDKVSQDLNRTADFLLATLP